MEYNIGVRMGVLIVLVVGLFTTQSRTTFRVDGKCFPTHEDSLFIQSDSSIDVSVCVCFVTAACGSGLDDGN
jgi:hypothetical protein